MIDRFKDDHAFLSNFYRVHVTLDGVVYPSVENAYMAAKTLDTEQRRAFETCSASEAKAMGRLLQLRPDWEEVKLDVMKKLLIEKFEYEHMKEKLLATKGHELVEGNFWGDTFYGVCNGVGQNHLGRMLMEIRDNISE